MTANIGVTRVDYVNRSMAAVLVNMIILLTTNLLAQYLGLAKLFEKYPTMTKDPWSRDRKID